MVATSSADGLMGTVLPDGNLTLSEPLGAPPGATRKSSHTSLQGSCTMACTVSITPAANCRCNAPNDSNSFGAFVPMACFGIDLLDTATGRGAAAAADGALASLPGE